MDINIITAERARKIAKEYIPYEIKSAMEYVMNYIRDSAEYGSSSTTFSKNSTPCIYYDTIKSEKFKEYIEKLGYHHSFSSEELWGCYSEWVTISW